MPQIPFPPSKQEFQQQKQQQPKTFDQWVSSYMSVQKPTQMTFTEPPYLGYNAPVKPKLNAPEVKANNEKAVSEAVQRLYQLQNEQQTRKQGIANNLLNMTAPTKKGRKK